MDSTMIKIEKYKPVDKIVNRKKVAAYARVSRNSEEAHHSLLLQIDSYKDQILSNPTWQFAGIYIDDGVSGTKTNRPEFNRMMDDARAGKIDLILTKSLSRFSRNTVTLLNTIRELNKLGVEVFFDSEHISTKSKDGELLLTILSMGAESYAQNYSELAHIRFKKGYEAGIPQNNDTYGYRNKNGKYVIIPEEAEVVKHIFNLYLNGYGEDKIAQILQDEGVTTHSGRGKWSGHIVGCMLQNEAYCGYVRLQKQYKTFYDKKMHKNIGQKTQYILKDHHEPIIEKELWDKAQELRKERQVAKDVRPNVKKFQGLLTCEECGRKYVYRASSNWWVCAQRRYDWEHSHDSQGIKEARLIAETLKFLGLESLDDIDPHDYLERIEVDRFGILTFIPKERS